MFVHSIIDEIRKTKYETVDRKEAESYFERCVMEAVKNGHYLLKGVCKYITECGKKIERNWGNGQEERDMYLEEDFYSSYTCELCGDAIKEDFGFCSRCKGGM